MFQIIVTRSPILDFVPSFKKSLSITNLCTWKNILFFFRHILDISYLRIVHTASASTAEESTTFLPSSLSTVPKVKNSITGTASGVAHLHDCTSILSEKPVEIILI
jgi:hypothetical protein